MVEIPHQAVDGLAGVYRALFERGPYAVLLVDYATLRVLGANDAAAAEYRYPPDELADLPLEKLWPRGKEVLARRRAGQASDEAGQAAWRHLRKSGEAIDVEIGFQEISVAGRPVVALHVSNVTHRAFSVALLETHNRLLDLVARGSPLPSVLDELVLAMERLSSGMLGSVLLLDDDGRHARHGAAPNLPPAYRQAIDGIRIGPRAGSCGTAMHLGRLVITADIALDPFWDDYRALALPHGLRACWSTPVRSSAGTILGAFAMYYREARAPGERDLRLVEAGAALAAIAIERDRAERGLQRSREELRALAARLHSVREEERLRISRDIHDHLGQILTVLRMNQSLLIRSVREASAVDREAVAAQLESMQELVGSLLSSVRRIVTELRPEVLDTLGLAAALEWQAAEFSRRTGIACAVSLPGGAVQAGTERSTALFRIFQEALSNVARHAGATRVSVELRRQGSFLEMRVADDGRGITPAEERGSSSLGLLGMRERAAMLGGTAAIAGAPGRGTTVTVRLPAD